MFRFGTPEFLYLLLLVPLAALLLVYTFRMERLNLQRFGNSVVLEKLSRTVSRRKKILKAGLLITGLTLLLLALPRPQFGTRVETVKREGQDIIVALDVSLSMLAEDIRPNRLEKAKHEVTSLINRLEGDRIGIVIFAGEAFVQCPLTGDYGAARLFLSAVAPDLMPVPGTAIADAIDKSLGAFVEGETRNKVLVLITDGEDHDGNISEMAQRATDEGVVIYSIGIGTPQGVPIPLGGSREQAQGFKKDTGGEVVLTKLNENALRDLATKTGGDYFRATSQGRELDRIYESVSSMDKKELAERQLTLFEERFQIPLIAGLLFLLFEPLISTRRRVQSTWRGRFQ